MDPDPTPDPIPFVSGIRDVKKRFFHIVFLIPPKAHYLPSFFLLIF